MIKHAYIHIPFCIRKCRYCSFVSGLDISEKDLYLKSLLKEIKSKYKSEALETLYIGGGTPSLLEAEDIENIINHFNFKDNAEITLEANPETVSSKKFSLFRKSGINRISLGIQTFNNNILSQIGRNHDEKCIYKAIETILNTGFENISIDLIYGLPSQTTESFKSDLEKAVNLKIKHISAYGLKIEEGSYFYKNPPSLLPDEDMQVQCFLELCDFLKSHKFEHYEISNFAIPGFMSRHNLCYWKNKNYYGFGLNASGYEGNIRYKNTSIFNEYINNPIKREEEITLTKKQTEEEEIFLALRLKEGINISKLKPHHHKIIEKYQKYNLLEVEKNHLKLTEKGILLSNEIMSEFID